MYLYFFMPVIFILFADFTLKPWFFLFPYSFNKLLKDRLHFLTSFAFSFFLLPAACLY